MFRFEHREGNARSLEVQPLGDEIEEASLFEIEVALRHGFTRANGQAVWTDAANVSGNKGAEIGKRDELRMGANAARRAGPDGMQDFVQEMAALFGGETGFSGVPAFGIEARGGEGFEGALRLRGECRCAAVSIAGREGNVGRIQERRGERGKAAGAASSDGKGRGAQASCSTSREGRASTPSL